MHNRLLSEFHELPVMHFGDNHESDLNMNNVITSTVLYFTEDGGWSSSKEKAIIGGVCGGLTVVCLVLLATIVMLRTRRNSPQSTR